MLHSILTLNKRMQWKKIQFPIYRMKTLQLRMTMYKRLFGTLTYEDKWPEEGDYDMNDVMIDYESTIYKTLATNKITKIYR